MVPAVGSSLPASSFKKVDLPLPESPTYINVCYNAQRPYKVITFVYAAVGAIPRSNDECLQTAL
jgi:hypothetical protein